MYKRTKYKLVFHQYYPKAYVYYRTHIDTTPTSQLNGEQHYIDFEDWMLAQGAYFHRRNPAMKQNHNLFFETDEQRTMFLLKVSG